MSAAEIRARVQRLERGLAGLRREELESADVDTVARMGKTLLSIVARIMQRPRPSRSAAARMLKAAEQDWKNIHAWRLARKLKPAPRGGARLYREAFMVLEREGANCSTNDVRLALKASEVVTRIDSDAKVLHWTADSGAPKQTTFKQFGTGVSRHRARLRKK